MYKADLACTNILRGKPTGNNSGFITYFNTLDISGLWSDNCSFFYTYGIFGEKKTKSWVKKLGILKRIIRVGKLSGKYDIITLKKGTSTNRK